MRRDSLVWFRRAARVAALLAMVVVVVGAWVRLTQAGLGCPDWPGCYGHVTAAGVVDHAAEAGAAYARPFEYQKALHEMVHRYIASTLGLLIIGLAVLSVVNRRDPEQPKVLPWVVLGLVCVQGALGAFTVTLLLTPLVVTAHLIGGLSTASLLYWLSLTPAVRQTTARERAVRPLALVALGALICQLLLGGWTSTNYAAVACPDFPTCQGSFHPVTDYAEGFRLTHGLGINYEGGVLTGPARTAIHYTHRLGAVVVALLYALLAVTAWRSSRQSAVRAAAVGVGVAVTLQWLIGMNLIWHGFPLWLGTSHNAGALLLVLATLTLLRTLWPRSSRGL
jgi:cytochrome c oxidase assembly protein subunit 15